MTRGRTGTRHIPLASAALAAALFFCAPRLWAQEVTLTTPGQSLQLRGHVLGFDGQNLRLQTDYGELTLRYDGVTCDGTDCPDPASYVPSLRFSGADRIATLILPALIEGFARDQGYALERPTAPEGWIALALRAGDGRIVAEFHLAPGSTETGLADLVAGRADIALAARALTRPELDRARAAGLGRLDGPGRVRVLAYDAYVPVAAPGQPVAAIGLADLALVLTGRVDNWVALGGADRPINLYLADDGLGQTDGLIAALLAPDGGAARADIRHGLDGSQTAAAIAADPDGLGLLPFDSFGETQPLALRDSCGIRAVPRPATVKTGDYPLTAPLYLYLPMRRLPAAGRGFMAWLATSQAQLILRRAGVLGADPVPIPLDQQGERLAAAIAAAGPEVPLAELQRMIRRLSPMVRLSPTFRFEDGSTRLEPASRSGVLQLAQGLRDGRYGGQTLFLIGFSDGRGPAEANRDLAAARADAVRRQVLAALGGGLPPGATLEVDAFGEALPIGCDDTPWGLRMNRRVELWVSDG